MLVKSININNLRNLSSVSIDLDPHLNCFVGENGAGKTSILEALAVLSRGRSFRSGQMAALIGPDQPYLQVVSKIRGHTGTRHHVGMKRSRDGWSGRHNGEDVSQLSDLTVLLPYALLEPSSHTLISGPPDGRRKYLDWGVFHVEHTFLLLWRRYNRALKQRNAALRRSDQWLVESLDPQLVSLGGKLHEARQQHAEKLAALLKNNLPQFNQALGNIELKYRKGWTGESLKGVLAQSFQRDMERGATGPGPHRADLVLTLDGVAAKERLSRGEQKTMTAAMIMAQAQMMCESGDRPVLLLDDLSSELDEAHLTRVLQAGMDLGVQIWLTGTGVTAAVENSVVANGVTCAMFHVEHGEVKQAAVNGV